MTDPARLALQQARSGKGLSDNEAYTLTQIEADRTDELLAAGVKAFADSYDDLLEDVSGKASALLETVHV